MVGRRRRTAPGRSRSWRRGCSGWLVVGLGLVYPRTGRVAVRAAQGPRPCEASVLWRHGPAPQETEPAVGGREWEARTTAGCGAQDGDGARAMTAVAGTTS